VLARARRGNGVEVEEIHSVDAIMPVVSAEGAARQGIFHDVEELAVAEIDFYLAIVEQIIGDAEAR